MASQDMMMIVVMMMMMSSVFSVLAGGAFFLNKPEEGDVCKGPSVGGNYVIDEDGECVLDYCDVGYVVSGGGCAVDTGDGGAGAGAGAGAGDGGAGAGAGDGAGSVTYTVPTDENSKAKCYLSRYPDLRLAFGSDLDAAKSHWTNHGLNENRDKSCEITDDEASCYLDRYPDMIAGYGEDLDAGRKHYYEVGINSDLDFACPPAKKEIECYLDRYPDLQQNLPATPFNQKYRALRHWNEFGKNENRSYACDP